ARTARTAPPPRRSSRATRRRAKQPVPPRARPPLRVLPARAVASPSRIARRSVPRRRAPLKPPRTARRPPHRPPPLHRLSRPINRPLRRFLTTTTPTATSSLLPELPTPPQPTIAAEPRQPPRSRLLASHLPKVRGALGPPCLPSPFP